MRLSERAFNAISHSNAMTTDQINESLARIEQAMNCCVAAEPGQHQQRCTVCEALEEALRLLRGVVPPATC